MTGVVYRSVVTIERVGGPVRRAYLPGEQQPVVFGVHGAVAQHYQLSPGTFEPHATTLDYVVAAAAGWLTGTFGGALEARGIAATGDQLSAAATGEIEETEDHVLVIRRINVRLRLRAPADQRAVAERVHGVFASHCPVYRSLRDAIAITTELEFTPAWWVRWRNAPIRP